MTAPNIRHKVKHPLFLSVRFSNVLKIYLNTRSKHFCEKEVTVKYFSYVVVKLSHQQVTKETDKGSWYGEEAKKFLKFIGEGVFDRS